MDHEPAEAMAYNAPKAPFYLKLVSPTLEAKLEDLAPITKDANNSLG